MATDRIVGSHASSFSELAGLLTGHGGYETSVDPPQALLAERLDAVRATTPALWNTVVARRGVR